MLLLEDGGLLRVYSYILSSFYVSKPPQMDTFTGFIRVENYFSKGGGDFWLKGNSYLFT